MAPEEAGDEDANGPPPHPLDRPWVHPSELFAGDHRRPRRAPGPGARSGARDVVLAVGAGVIGALAMVVVLALAGLLGDSSTAGRPSPDATDQPDEPDGAARLAAVANPASSGSWPRRRPASARSRASACAAAR